MENYYYSDLSKEPSYSVPTPIVPHVPEAPSSVQFYKFPSWSIPIEGAAEDRAATATATASNSHSQAEKRRRDRINAQLATLRKLIPMSDKMDKAALLGSVIEHVKDLKRKAIEINKAFTLPTEVDEVTVDQDPAANSQDEISRKANKFKHNIVIKASVCCDDRPELFSELIQVLKALRMKAIKADVASVGGRIKSTLVLCSKNNEEGVCLNTLKHSLKLVVGKIASASMQSNSRIRSKRQRFFLPSYHS
ncbi:Transcription factor [Quillaja saponaria]|uniref:Transcription factor n=1 Tax=Quillaja saponaria TaxID=32244 RepID=A0AAD7LK39_QUISA|nr:Transcription factor [Quillaja saponaria]KAJ7959631.1 Transcription factor [Quillaja saponaria]